MPYDIAFATGRSDMNQNAPTRGFLLDTVAGTALQLFDDPNRPIYDLCIYNPTTGNVTFTTRVVSAGVRGWRTYNATTGAIVLESTFPEGGILHRDLITYRTLVIGAKDTPSPPMTHAWMRRQGIDGLYREGDLANYEGFVNAIGIVNNMLIFAGSSVSAGPQILVNGCFIRSRALRPTGFMWASRATAQQRPSDTQGFAFDGTYAYVCGFDRASPQTTRVFQYQPGSPLPDPDQWPFVTTFQRSSAAVPSVLGPCRALTSIGPYVVAGSNANFLVFQNGNQIAESGTRFGGVHPNPPAPLLFNDGGIPKIAVIRALPVNDIETWDPLFAGVINTFSLPDTEGDIRSWAALRL